MLRLIDMLSTHTKSVICKRTSEFRMQLFKGKWRNVHLIRSHVMRPHYIFSCSSAPKQIRNLFKYESLSVQVPRNIYQLALMQAFRMDCFRMYQPVASHTDVCRRKVINLSNPIFLTESDVSDAAKHLLTFPAIF